MNKPIVRLAAAFAMLALVAIQPAFARGDKDREPLQVALNIPAATGKAQPVNLPTGAPARSIGLRVEDGRGAAAGTVIGQGTSDDVVVFPILATNDIDHYVEGVASQTVASWGLDTASAKDGVLVLRYTQLSVTHRGRAVGATYVGEAKLKYELTNRAGRVVAEGNVSGAEDHYGKGRSVENCNEALRDGLRNALAQLLNEPGFRKVWSDSFVAAQPVSGGSGKQAAATEPAPARGGKAAGASSKTIEARLRKLEDLYKNGTITKDEYDRRRQEILSEI